MRFKTFLNEDDNLQLEYFKKDLVDRCLPFLKDFYKTNSKMTLCRGVENTIDKYESFEPRKNRKSRDTPTKVHDYLNSIYNEKFGIALRSNSVFCTTNIAEIKKWYVDTENEIYFCIPHGKYEIYWNKKIKDIYIYLEKYKPINSIKNSNIWNFLPWEPSYVDMISSSNSDLMYHSYFKTLKTKTVLYIVNDDYYLFLKRKDEDLIHDSKALENLYFKEEGYYPIKIEKVKKEEITFDIVKEILASYISKASKQIFNQIINNTIKGNLDGALKSKNEIMLICNQYYLVNRKWWQKNNMDEYINEFL